MLLVKNRMRAVKSLALVIVSTAIFSFVPKFGGEYFEIYLNNKLISQQAIVNHEAVKTLQLDPTVSDGLVIISYSHCGVVGKDRYILLKDEKNNIVKKWHFADATGNDKNMSCKVKEILDLQKQNGNKFSLYYSSKELPNGRLLASVVVTTEIKRNS